MLANQVFQMTPKPGLDLTAIATANTACVFMTANFISAAWSNDTSYSESLLYVLQNVLLVDPILHDLFIAVISHITKLQI